MSRRIGRMAAGLALAVLLPSAAHAASENAVTFGSRWWTQTSPEASFREYLDLNRGGFLQSFTLRQWNASDAAVLSGENEFRLDQSTRLALSHGVRWQLEIKNDQIPHNYSFTARTPYTEVAPGVYRLPDSLQARTEAIPGNFGKNMIDALQEAPLTDLNVQTQVSSVRLRARPVHGWRFEVKGEERLRDGHKPYGGTFGFSSAIELMEPIHQRTLNGTASATYEHGPARVTASAGVSDFNNKVDAMIWDNPLRLTDRSTASDAASSQGRLALYPDNRVLSGNVALGYRLPRRTMFTGTVGVSQGKQDQAFLPMTINSAIAQGSLDSLPARSLDGKTTRISQDYRITTRPWNRTSGTLRYNYSKLDDKSPELTFIGSVRADESFTRGALTSKTFGHTDSRVGLDLDAQPLDPVGVGITVERRMRDRTEREVEKDNENVFAAHASAELPGDATFAANFRYGDRKLDHFDITEYENATGALTEQALLRRFDVASRKQTQGGGDLSWDPARWITLEAQYTYLLDDYPDSRYGLTRDEQHQVVAQATLHPRERLDLSGGYGFGQTETKQNSNETNASGPPTADAPTDWTARLKDKNVYVFTSAEWWAIERKLVFNADYQFTRALGTYDFISQLPAQNLPANLYRQHDLEVGSRWRIQNSTELGARYYWTEYDVNDVLTQNIPLLQFTGASPTAIYLGDSRLAYRAHRFEVLATRRF